MNVIGVSSSAASASALARAASSGLISECRRLLALGADPLFAESRPLRLAAGHGRLDCVALLIPVSDLRTFTVSPLFHAAMAGEVECIRALLPGSPPLDDFPAPLKAASWHGHAKAVALMLEYAPEAASCWICPLWSLMPSTMAIMPSPSFGLLFASAANWHRAFRCLRSNQRRTSLFAFDHWREPATPLRLLSLRSRIAIQLCLCRLLCKTNAG